MADYIKIGAGSFFVILGLYIINKFPDNVSVIGGIFCIALGIGIVASAK
ncbi:MAG: hypothetical protein ABIJ14_03375 [Nanoarchaeota archaeon]